MCAKEPYSSVSPDAAIIMRAGLLVAGMLLSTYAAFAAEPMAPSDIQATFFNGKPFTAATTSGTQFKMIFTPDGKTSFFRVRCMRFAGDPVGGGLVTSLAHPGGNVTGMSLQEIDTAGKRLEMLREVIPGLQRIAIVANSSNSSSALEMREVQKAADTFGLKAISLDIQRANEITPGLAGLKGRADALYVCGDPLMRDRRAEISSFAANAKLPTMFNQRSNVEAGGLMSYGPSFADLYRRAAEIVDKILRGTKPGDIPVEQPTKFELVVNLNTARALGLIVPQTLLATADEVIE